MHKTKVIFPDESTKSMPAFIQRDLLDPNISIPQPEDHPDWDFEKLEKPSQGAIWAAIPAEDREKDYGKQ